MQTRFLINRIVNFIRPQPQRTPLTVAEVFQSTQATDLIEKFSDFFYTSGVAGLMNWRGQPLLKNPCDLWMYIELMQKLQPRVILETGTNYGGSATFFADMMKMFGFPCTVITIDFNPKWAFDPATKNIVSLVGYTTAPNIVAEAKMTIDKILAEKPGHVLGNLDSGHSEENVLEELRLYGPMITKDSYMIVEDTNVNGHPSYPTHGPGPFEAVEKYMKESSDFVIDEECQKYLLTFNPRGYLRKVK